MHPRAGARGGFDIVRIESSQAIRQPRRRLQLGERRSAQAGSDRTSSIASDPWTHGPIDVLWTISDAEKMLSGVEMVEYAFPVGPRTVAYAFSAIQVVV